MSFYKISAFLQSFLDPRRAWLLAGLLVAAGCFPVHAQTSGTSHQAVRLNLVAVDSAGRPVPDLTVSDLAVFDNGSPQQIVSLRLNQTDRPRPLVLLFDLLNADESSRGAVWNSIKTSLAHLSNSTAGGPLYLYLLAEDGSLYPVHALPGGPAATQTADASWAKDIGPLLDAAMQKATQLRPQDFRAVSPIALQSRFKATYGALDNMRVLMARLPGPKELLWVTYGIPSAIHLADRTWFDGVPPLRQLGAQFVRSETTVYTADPGINLQVGTLNRDSLDILTGVTGGHVYSTIDLNRALAQIEAEAHTNYSLEYQPSANNWDGKYHKLRVTAARKGVHLRTEAGYFAAARS
ncbi:MAG TPA: VWA domain-containing protein [Bryobacteraceae bacterium]|nr:VWA domain-containing protein [Bryobacteraceae bacterium]